MALRHLNQKTIESLKTEKLQEDVWDLASHTPGVRFGVRITKGGTKEYICRYKDRQRKRRRLSIGNTKLISLREAHEKIRDVAARLDLGLDPAEERDAQKEAMTFGGLCEEYLRQHACYKKDGGKEDSRIINSDLLPAWKNFKVCDIRRRDIITLLDGIAHGRGARVMANRTRALVSKIFNFGIEREWTETTPCIGLPRKHKETGKDRVLSEAEIKVLWKALEREPLVLSVMMKMILLTGQRPGEVAGARWSEFQDDIWTIPSERVKNGRTHRIPISPQVIELMRCMKNDAWSHKKGCETYVFPSHRSETMSLHAVQNLTLRYRNKPIDGLRYFTPHDLRRTCITSMRGLGVGRETAARILNHTPKTVTLVYDRYDEMPEMRRAMILWGTKLEALVHSSAAPKIDDFLDGKEGHFAPQADSLFSILL
jgi:integrase